MRSNRRYCLTGHVVVLGVVVLFAVASHDATANYLENLRSITFPNEPQDWDAVPDSARSLAELALQRRGEGDWEGCIEVWSRVAAMEELDLDSRTYALADKALLEEYHNMYPAAMESMRTIKELRKHPEAEEVLFLVDLEMARAMADSGGHPHLPDFNPTIEEKEQQFEVLFLTYSPYRREMIEAHLKLATEYVDEASEDPSLVHYAKLGIEQLHEARRIVEEIRAHPALAYDRATLHSLDIYSGGIELKLRDYGKYRKYLEKQARRLQKDTDRVSTSPQPPAPVSREETIRIQMQRRYYREPEADAFAEKYGKEAVPFLIEMLETEETPPYVNGKVCFFLGKLRDARAVKPIVEFIEKPMPHELSRDEQSAIISAMLGLGFTGSDDALGYLRKLASEKYWLDRSGRPTIPDRHMGEAKTRKEFRQQAVEAIGRAAPEKVIGILRELKQGDAADLKVEICIWEAQRKMKGLSVPDRKWLEYEQYGETDAEAFAKEYGKEAVPFLIEMLESEETRPRVKGKGSFYLGKLGDPRAVQPMIDLIERPMPEELSRDERQAIMWTMYGLGFIGNDTALHYLKRLASEDYWLKRPVYPRTPSFKRNEAQTRRGFRESALRGLGLSGKEDAISILRELKEGAANDMLEDVNGSIEWAEGRIEGARRDREFEKLRHQAPLNDQRLAAFWNHQEVVPSRNLARDIVGEYTGSVYWTDYSNDNRTEGLVMRFLRDGTFETNMAQLAPGSVPRRMGRDAPKLADAVSHKGKYRVLGPTQLLLSPGTGVTSFGVNLRQGRLTFYHQGISAFFSLQKKGVSTASPPRFSGDDFAGSYTGLAYVAEQGAKGMAEVENVEIIFNSDGHFTTNFGATHGKLLQGFNTADGTYVLDDADRLALHLKIHGGDFFGATTAGFFDWAYLNRQLYVNHFHGAYYGCVLVLSPFNQPVKLDNTRLIKTLTRGSYRGSAYRPTPDGEIEEIEGITLQFLDDGTYRSNFPAKLKGPEHQYYPMETGFYVAMSDRHLYMADQWQDGNVTNAGVTDCLIKGDNLYFSCFKRGAYFVLRK